jgi:hypothetical protein
MQMVLATGLLPSLGQLAAIILLIFLFVSTLVSLLLVAVLTFGFAWLREKTELLKKLRPHVNQLNRALEASQRDEPLPQEVADNKVVGAIARIPRIAEALPGRANAVEARVDQGSERVAAAVIEVHARVSMVKGIARAFFVPQTLRPRRALSRIQTSEASQLGRDAEVTLPTVEPPVYEEEITIVQSSR